jgi:AraC-like DNA-binding protein
MLVVAPGKAQSLAAEPVRHTVQAETSCRLLADGLVKFVARDGEGVDGVQGFDAAGEGGLLVVCGTITATVGGRFGLFDHLTGPVVADIRAEPAMHAAFDQLLRELGMPGVGSRALSEALMKQCLVLLMRNLLARGGAETALFSAIADPRLARTVSAVLADPGAPHTVQSLAVEAGMSRSVFAERFVAAYGESPFGFVQSARLDHAARLLRISDLPVKSVASVVGYASRSHFSRAFRSAYGKDPTKYRSEARA